MTQTTTMKNRLQAYLNRIVKKSERTRSRSRRSQACAENLEQRLLLTTEFGGVSLEETQILADYATEVWEDAGISSDQLAALENLTYQVADLGENNLGQYRSGVITIDDNAGGNLWFVDQTPSVNEEFTAVENTLTADDSTLGLSQNGSLVGPVA